MISILCPSRGRPELAKKMVDTALELAGAPIEILIYLNDDDPKLNQYQSLINPEYLLIGPDRSPAFSWNKLAEMAKYDLLFLMGDDAWFETENWALKIHDVFDLYPDKLVFAFPSVDGLEWRGGKLTPDHCPHFILHKNWINTLGYFLPPQFWHWYIDTWHREIAKLVGRYHPIKNVSVPLLVDFEDETDARKDRLCNRERDHWLWNHTQRWLHADANAIYQKINMRR